MQGRDRGREPQSVQGGMMPMWMVVFLSRKIKKRNYNFQVLSKQRLLLTSIELLLILLAMQLCAYINTIRVIFYFIRLTGKGEEHCFVPINSVIKMEM